MITRDISSALLEKRCFFLRKLLGENIHSRRFWLLREKIIGKKFGSGDYLIIKPSEINLSQALILAKKNLPGLENLDLEYLLKLEDNRPDSDYFFIVNKMPEEMVNPENDLTLVERILLELYCVKIKQERFMPGSLILCTASKTKDGKSPYLLYNEANSRYVLSMTDYNNIFIDKTRDFYVKVIEK